MANGNYAYFSHFKKEYQLKYNLFVLKDYLPEKHFNNLIVAKEIYDSYSNKKKPRSPSLQADSLPAEPQGDGWMDNMDSI